MSSNKKLEPGDVNIISLRLSDARDTRSVDIRMQLQSMSIYESIKRPLIYAEFTLLDTLGLLKDFPVVGEEKITLEYETPGISSPTKYVFQIFSVNGNVTGIQNKSSLYVLRCSSVEIFNAVKTNVSRGFNQEIHKSMQTLLREDLKSEKKYHAEPTKGVQQIVLPNIPIMSAVDFLRRRAVSAINTSSSFVFFENQDGFVFKTIEQLIEEGKSRIGTKQFTYSADVNTKAMNEQAYRNIVAYHTLSKFDMTTKTGLGGIRSNMTVFDVLRKTVENIDFNINQSYDKFKQLDNNAKPPNTIDYYTKQNDQPSVNFYVPIDATKDNSFLPETIPARIAYANMISQNRIVVYLYGDTSIKAGDVVACNFPETSGATTETKSSDAMLSGNYLVAKVRHIVERTSKPKHMMSCELIKGSFSGA